MNGPRRWWSPGTPGRWRRVAGLAGPGGAGRGGCGRRTRSIRRWWSRCWPSWPGGGRAAYRRAAGPVVCGADRASWWPELWAGVLGAAGAGAGPVRRRGAVAGRRRASRCSSSSARTATLSRARPGRAAGRRRGPDGAVSVPVLRPAQPGPAAVLAALARGARARASAVDWAAVLPAAGGGWTCRPTRSSTSGTGPQPSPAAGARRRGRARDGGRGAVLGGGGGRRPGRRSPAALAVRRRAAAERGAAGAGVVAAAGAGPVGDRRLAVPGDLGAGDRAGRRRGAVRARGCWWSRPGWPMSRARPAGVRAGAGRGGAAGRDRDAGPRPSWTGRCWPDRLAPVAGRAADGRRAWCRCWRWMRARCRVSGGARRGWPGRWCWCRRWAMPGSRAPLWVLTCGAVRRGGTTAPVTARCRRWCGAWAGWRGWSTRTGGAAWSTCRRGAGRADRRAGCARCWPGCGEDQVAVRAGGVLARRLVRAPLPGDRPEPWRAGAGPVLVTGGTGASAGTWPGGWPGAARRGGAGQPVGPGRAPGAAALAAGWPARDRGDGDGLRCRATGRSWPRCWPGSRPAGRRWPRWCTPRARARRPRSTD